MSKFYAKLTLLMFVLFQLGCDAAISNWIGMRSNFKPDDFLSAPSNEESPTTPAEFSEKASIAVLNNIESTYIYVDKVKFSADDSLIYQIVYDGYGARVMSQSLAGGYPNILTLPIQPHFQRTDISLTPDNQYFIYIANQTPGSPDNNIYAFKKDGSSFTKLNPSLVTNGDVAEFFYSSTGSRVVYGADADIDTKEELYSVRLDGTGFTKLNTPITNGAINEWFLSPDQNTVFYRGRSASTDRLEVFAAAIDGSNLRKISDTLQASGDVLAFKVSADGQWVVYIADQVVDNQYELFVAPVYTVSSSTKVSTNLIPAGDVYVSSNFFGISSDGSKIIYTADVSVDEELNVYAVNRNGTGHVKLNAALAANRDAAGFAISSDGTKAFFFSDGGATDNIWNLYSVNTDGTGLATLIPYVANTTSTPFYPTNLRNRISGSLQKVIMVADVDGNAVNELYSVNWDGTGLIKISPATMETIYFSPDMAFSADDQMMAFSLYNVTYPRAFAVNADGTGLVQLNTQGTSDEGGIQYFSFSNTGHRLAASFPKPRLYTSNLSTFSEILPVVRQFGYGYSGQDYWISADSSKVFYNKIVPGSTTQFTAQPIVGGSEQTILPYAAITPTFNSNNQTIHYNYQGQLYKVNTDGTGAAKISGAPDISVFLKWRYSPNGQKIAYTARQDDSMTDELYALNIDGTSRVKLNLALQANGDVADWEFSPDSTKIVYSSAEHIYNQWDLHAVNIDGTGNVKLTPAMPHANAMVAYPNYARSTINLTPDGSKIVYAADQVTLGVTEAFSVNWDGTANTKIIPTPVAGGDVYFLLAAPNSQKVVVLGNLIDSTKRELFSTNLDGTGFTKISSSLVAGGNVYTPTKASNSSMAISADSQNVLFIADKTVDEKFELYSAKMDGTQVTQVSPNMISTGDVASIQLTPDKTKVIFLADTEVDGKIELYIANIDGTQLKKLNRSLSSSDLVIDYKVSNQKVAYRVRRGEFYELYIVNVDGTNQSRVHSTLSNTIFGIDAGYYFNQTFDKLLFSDNISNYLKRSIRWVDPN